MAVAEIIGAAVGVLLLVVVAYLLVGGTLSTAETVVMAQKDVTLLQESRLRTSITISDHTFDGTMLNFNISNTGSETVTDLPHMDVFSYNRTYGYSHYQYDRTRSMGEGTWYVPVEGFENDFIHSDQLDPGVKMWVILTFSSSETPEYPKPDSIQVTTGNGVSAEKIVAT